jgi:hypothetical protein
MTRHSRLVRFGVVVAVVVVLLLAFLTIKIVPASSGGKIADDFSDAPFGPFAGYAWIGSVHSVGASFTVPPIASGSPLGVASTWIGAQSAGPPSRFVQIGDVESRLVPRGKDGAVDRYYAIWSDTARHYQPIPLFPVNPADTLSASLTLAHQRWTLAIVDDTSGAKAHFSTAAETEAPFNQAAWAQENPGSENHHVPYPRIAPPVFHGLTVNSARPSPTALYSQWMSVNHNNLAPTTVHADSFTLKRAPPLSPAGAQYLRLSATSGAAFDQFQDERAEWTTKTPYKQIEAASLRFITATQNGARSLAAAPWPKQLRSLIRANAHMKDVVLELARPPGLLTAATFADWNSRLTEALERAAPAGAKLRLALGLPGFGPEYHR